jgi:uncharacterized protein (DUF2252 family)
LYNVPVESFTFNTDDTPTHPRSRPSWAKDHIHRFNKSLEPRAREKKNSILARSPFDFFLGTNQLFWADFGESEWLNAFGGGKGTRIWISGDLHCDNFGSFADATGRLVYDLNNFEQSIVADYQYDLWRLGTSLVLLGRKSQKNPKAIRRMVVECARGYWREIKSCRWYKSLSQAPWDEEQAAQSLRHYLIHARKHYGYPHLLERWTKPGKNGLGFKTQGNPDLEILPKEIARKLEKALKDFAANLKPWPMEKPRVFEIEDLALRLNNGPAREGQKHYYALVRVREEAQNPYRILEMKQQVEPGAWDNLSKKSLRKTRKLCGNNQALRVELANRALSRQPNPWLGILEWKGDDYTVDELSPYGDVLPGDMMDETAAYQLGGILARAHCRTKGSFAKKAFENIKKDKKEFRRLVADLSLAYADQVEEDYRAFVGTKLV